MQPVETENKLSAFFLEHDEPQSHRLGSKICLKSSMFQDKPDYYGRNTVNYSSNLFFTDAKSHEITFTGF